ncbi:MAG: hypothetical protein R3C16_03690 [Hyphomonadaceae bacterium]
MTCASSSEVAAGGAVPLDVSIAQRATLGSDQDGNIDRQGRGSELRIGRGLVNRRDDDEQRSVYMFVASDNEALTYEPGARSEFGGRGSRLSLEDRAEVGDLSAGVTIERNGVQTSLATSNAKCRPRSATKPTRAMRASPASR